MTTLRVTELGKLAVRYSVMTDGRYWSQVFKEANRVADEDGDLDLFFNEKISGLTEMRDRFYELNDDILGAKA